MVFALLISSIVWNLGTWYLGLPASSSHTLIGSIVGVGLMNSLMIPDGAFGDGVNWVKVEDTVKALVLSPLLGFVAAGLLLLAAKALLRNPALYRAPEGDEPPPLWIRGLLVLTCTGVSFAHGSNDGQKGMGLIVLILVGIVPTAFALNPETPTADVHRLAAAATLFSSSLDRLPETRPRPADADTAHKQLTQYLRSGRLVPETMPALAVANTRAAARLGHLDDVAALPAAERVALRLDAYLVSETLARMQKAKQLPAALDPSLAASYQKSLKRLTNFIPLWVKVAVSLALGLGTMIGWKRIVVTVGEKIGKAHLTYAQGAAAELVAFGTIEAADILGLPVSTTHILSSGIAGTMVANGSGIQKETVRNIVLAWVLTLPVCVLLGAALFGAALFFVLRVLGVH
ncbi:MAG: inorganic phosphate transporter [Gammaproteobacteria bacterium]|nr:inorganic phosphate transporter [Gammaproteobacteria bacterium]